MLFSNSLRALVTACLCLGSSARFTYNETSFLLDGHPFQIIGGQMDPQRIPPPYWVQRLKMARAMGLNTIFSYVFWNEFEPSPGDWDFGDANNVALFIHLAQKEGLKVVLRPGPYVSGERDWGGFPAWLSQVPGLKVRENNDKFLHLSRRYINRLAEEVSHLQASRGGPILMVQLENEYGSFGKDKGYLAEMADILRANFEVFLYTTDIGDRMFLRGGTLPGVLAQTVGDPKTGFPARDEAITDKSMLGPHLASEYHVTWPDDWSSNSAHRKVQRGGMDSIVSDLRWILQAGNSFNIYMFHGGTNWGYDNGAVWASSRTRPVTTSYDYGAPLDESGRPTEMYHRIRRMIAKHLPESSIPPVPQLPEPVQTEEIDLKPSLALFDILPNRLVTDNADPVTMETLGQWQGFVLYQHNVTSGAHGALDVGDKPRDRIIVYQNGQRVGVIDGTYDTPTTVRLTLNEGDLLQLLVENLGRVDFGPGLKDQRKGIVGSVRVGRSMTLKGWSTYSLPLTKVPKALSSKNYADVLENSPPIFYTGYFRVLEHAKPGLGSDTFLTLNGGIKGQIWVNGINLGRYWTIGPQQSLYLPGCYIKPIGSVNDVVVLELEPRIEGPPRAKGIASRLWFNRPDPDRAERLVSAPMFEE
ncbi:hypothetical protein L249_7765 [Ophiocordyceps polyrhachis-furcata BCC 54312]|uniref:Beta-galactosidase n=1 Tax=Ophiocordyceps polyrhachis-furcata BCC 54312 TaxID=1330021 RepID=A0A367L9Z5_9HYPO|nr:hypothetical protein L249_7765 [Ophiocordyceps polyrhachis-furcata BCC 54312]